MLNKIRENKVLKISGAVLYYVSLMVIIAILVVVIIQRVSNNNISVGGARIFNVATGSMVPKYEVGDILISKTVDLDKIKVGDDVVYLGNKDSFAGKVVTHEVIEIEEENGQYKFHTKGIANDTEDPVVSGSQIYGVIIYKVKILSFISKIIANIYAFYFFIFLPLTVLIVTKIREIYLDIKERQEEKKTDKE